MEKIELNQELKEVFLKFESKISGIHKIDDFKKKISSDNTFLNKMSYGSSVGILDNYLKNKKIIYITSSFICCEDGIILIGKKRIFFFLKVFLNFINLFKFGFQKFRNFIQNWV